ncbi:uncharacterized protein LOC114933029 [Nylanderia fulva]|uniref:uncharacterized protein LOC114930917 n=1 Tax=Nylanderia fulva TaxID=613905 RepID=UPI0010FB5D91|nr:uncharacterized protein LOC114930917 [Nylanderia fulva]XP_029161297.1 uncharacterized protein LOC114933029 [Nylanderia fulva]
MHEMAPETPLPQGSGGFSPIQGRREEDMDVVEETHTFILKKEDFPPLGLNKSKNRKKWETPGELDLPKRSKIPVALGFSPKPVEDEESDEKRRQDRFIAMIEGIVVREMDKRLGCPIPTYGETRKANKEETLAQAKQQQQPKGPVKARQAEPVEEKKKPMVKKVEVIRKAVKILPATTLNPPARPATVRAPGQTLIRMGNTPPATRERKAKPKAANKAESREGTLQTKTADTEKGETWAVVASKKTKRKEKAEAKETPKKAATNAGRKEPKTAAVTLTCPTGKYEEITQKARQKIDIRSMGIEGFKIKRAITGAIKYEISGKDGKKLADAFALELRKSVGGKEGVKVERPTKSAEIRIRGLDDATTPQEIRRVISEIGECEEEGVKVGDIKRTPSGIGMVWARCPLTAANKIVTATQVRIGWAIVRVEMLANRPLQCYKCLEGGHVRQRCPNKEDRSDRCYRCGESGHEAKKCEAVFKCPVCSDKGLPSNHRTGGRSCLPIQKGRRGIQLSKIIGTQDRKEKRDKEASLPLKSGEASTSQRGKKGNESKGTSLPLKSGEVPILPYKEREKVDMQKGGKGEEEPPKEQRVLRTRKQEEKLPEGVGKRRRIRKEMPEREDSTSGMETEKENAEGDVANSKWLT